LVSGIAVNGIADISISSKTLTEENPYWEVDLQSMFVLTGIKIQRDPEVLLGDFYVFISDLPFESGSLNESKHSEAIGKHHVAYSLDSSAFLEFPFPETGRYIRIQRFGHAVLSLKEVEIPGNPKNEDCTNGIDDDCDGLADCSDTDCKPKIFRAVTIQFPSCKDCVLCKDGIIAVTIGSNVPIANLSLSIDGGITFKKVNSYYNELVGLCEGDYNIVVRNGLCETRLLTPIKLLAIPGERSSVCINGDFEFGSFFGWNGFTGSNPGSTISGIVGGRHTLLTSGVDPIAPIKLPLSGAYCARLGNVETGRSKDELEFCFQVDSENQSFSYSFALVMEDSDHGNNENPFFAVEFFLKNPSTGQLVSFSKEIIKSEKSPFWSIAAREGTFYKNWTCNIKDLSQYLNQEVCVKFTAADCNLGAHFGYAYLDDICAPLQTRQPKPDLKALATKICGNQSIRMDASGSAKYNQYQVKVCQIKADGSKGLCKEGGKIVGSSIGIFDANVLSGIGDLPCGFTYEVTLTLFNDCSSPASISKSVFKDCEQNSLSYKDILFCGDQSQLIDLRVESQNNCVGCTFTWNNDQYLQPKTAENPTIMGTLWANALDAGKVYTVTATTPNGCKYTDEVTVFKKPSFIANIDVEQGCCSTEPFTNVVFPQVVDITMFDVSFRGKVDGVWSSWIKGNSAITSSALFSFRTSPKSFLLCPKPPSVYEVKLSWNNLDRFVVVGSNFCTKTLAVTPPFQKIFCTPISIVTTGYNFGPNALNPVNRKAYPLSMGDHQIQSGLFEVYDRWGERVWSASFDTDCSDSGPYYDLKKLGWDGYLRGKLMNPAVFVCVFTATNCNKGTVVKTWDATLTY
jgi:hypothetical protein